jgi:hypothetical protein
MDRRTLLLAGAAALVAADAHAAPLPEVTVYKTPWCTCCGGWVTHLRRAGFRVQVLEREDLDPIRAKNGVPAELASCHTAKVGAYALEGHVPPADVLRLLKQKPKAVGLAVPGMPLGSPGMEIPNGQREAFDTLLLLPGGRSRVFARHS